MNDYDVHDFTYFKKKFRTFFLYETGEKKAREFRNPVRIMYIQVVHTYFSLY